jgi:hypothetical protein
LPPSAESGKPHTQKTLREDVQKKPVISDGRQIHLVTATCGSTLGSTLPEQLRELGYDVSLIGVSERIILLTMQITPVEMFRLRMPYQRAP